MAQKDTRLNIDVTAEDRASKVLRDVKSDVDKLEQTDATVDIAADDNASPVLADIESAARNVDGTKATVDVQADDNASKTIATVDADRKDLDGKKATVAVQADDNATRVLDRIDSKLRDIDGRKATVGLGGAVAAGAAGGAVAGGGIPVVGEFVEGAQAASEWAIQVKALAEATGASLEDASRLAVVWRNSGLDLADLEDLMGNLQQVIRQNPDLAEQLHLSKANDGVTTFLQAVKNLQTEFDTAGDRGAAASQLFGEEGVRQVRRVQVLVDGDLKTAFDDVSQTQLVTDDQVNKAREMTKQANELALIWQRAQVYSIQALTGVKNYFAAVYRAGQNQPDISGGDIGNFVFPDADPVFSNLPAGINTSAPRSPFNADAPNRGRGGLVIINNPPGSPATVVEADRIYTRRNDIRS